MRGDGCTVVRLYGYEEGSHTDNSPHKSCQSVILNVRIAQSIKVHTLNFLKRGMRLLYDYNG